jgi:hypothetical protein
MSFIYLLNKKKCLEIIDKLNKQKISDAVRFLWNTHNEFDILSSSYYNQNFLSNVVKLSEEHIEKISIDLVYWCTNAAIYLFNNKKVLDKHKVRNDYVLTHAIINMIKINRPFALHILFQTKTEIIKYIQRGFYYE